MATSKNMIRDSAIVITDDRTVPDPPSGKFRLIELSLTQTAIELGNTRTANIVALSALAALAGLCDRARLEETLTRRSPKAFLDLNREALNKGWQMGQERA